MFDGSYVVNLFKQKVVSQKQFFCYRNTKQQSFFVINSLTIFNAQIVHSHMH